MTHLKVLLTVCALAALAGCQRDSGVSAQPQPAAHPRAPAAAQRPASPEELTVGMVEAAALGKSQLPVAVKFDLSQRPALGQPLDIGLAIIPGTSASLAAIDVAASEGLAVADGFAHVEIPSVEPGQVYRQSTRVTPSAEGVMFVTLKVSLTHDQVAESRTFSLPVIVGASPPVAGNPVP